MEKPDLALVETEQLVKELTNRFDAFICRGIQVKVEGQGSSARDAYFRYYRGNFAVTIGLAVITLVDLVWGNYAINK